MLRHDGGGRTRFPRIGSYALCAFVLIGLALVLRIALVELGWPLLDSDEGTMGLMALHIAYRGEHPIFFYGQDYMGAAEAYIAAFVFSLFGVSVFTLRLGLLLLFTGFLIAMYLLTSLLFGKKLALFTLALLCLGSNPILTRELVAVGGDPETLLTGSVLFLLATWLALTACPDGEGRNHWRRLAAYSGWGLAAGFGLWSHMLVAPFVLMSGLLLLIFCWRELLGWALLCLLVGLVIGGLPLIIYNLHAPPGEDSISVLWRIHRVVGIPQPPFRVLWRSQVKGALLVSLPTATGANPLCRPADAEAIRFTSLHALQCTLVHAGWSLGAILLWTIAALLALAGLWQYWHRSSAERPRSAEKERRGVVLHCARLALLLNAAITLVLYVLSPNAALFPVPTSRYLIGMLVTTPALLWPLWNGVGIVKPLAVRLFHITIAVRVEQVSVFLRRGALLLIGGIFLLGTFSTFTGVPPAPPVDMRQDVFATQAIDQHLGVPATQSYDRQTTTLIHDLLRVGATRIYSDYWTCDRLIFESHERIICSALSEGLGPGHDRYMPYRVMVTTDPFAAYVFRLGSPQAAALAHRAATSRIYRRKYRRLIFAGYVVYQVHV
jgi:hypothetical protein